MSAENQNLQGEHFLPSTAESEQANLIYETLRTLQVKNLISRDPHNVQIERSGRSPIFPCRRSYGPDILDLAQLEWAVGSGRWWFNGPIKSLKVVLDNGEQRIIDLERRCTSVYPPV